MSAKRVVLVYPKLEPVFHDRINFTPLPLLALSSVLVSEGYEVVVLDTRVENDKEGFIKGIGEAPLCFGISTMAGYQIKDGLIVAELVRKYYPDVPIVWGGKFPTIMPDEMLADERVDIVVRSQGEITFLEYLKAMETGASFSDIAGLSYKEKGKFVHNDSRPIIDPNEFPPMPYNILDITKYNCVDKGYINYISSYGCPYNCAFCTTTYIYARKWQGLDAERVLDEIEHLVKTYNVRTIDIQDDLFFVNLKRAKAILNGFIERKLNITWITTIRFNQLSKFDDDVFALMKKSGCETVYASAESGVQKILDYVHKGITTDDIEIGVTRLARYKIPTRTTFLLGTPSETIEDLKNTLDFANRMKTIYPELDIYFSFYMPIPGTPLFEMALKEKIITKPRNLEEWSEFIPVDQSQPWLFIPLHKLRNDARRLHRIVAFYYWAAYFPKLYEEMQRRGLGIFVSPVKFFASLRVKTGVFSMPVEWQLFRFLFILKKRLSGKSVKLHTPALN